MPTLGIVLDFAKYEARNIRAHQLGTAPASPVTGQLYYNTGDNTLYWWNGTTWITAAGGTAPDASTSSKGLVQLAGDLAGTAVSPQIAAGVIVNADVNGSAAIAESKLALASDAAAGTASRRTLGTGATQAAAGNDTRFTDARAPTGAAGGDLGSTYPNPTVVKAANGFTVAAGKATITDGAQATGGLIIGADTNLYRGAANQLKTDDDLYVATRIGVGNTPSATEGRIRLPAGTTKADGISFCDEIWLHNEGTATLKLNGALRVVGGFDADGNLLRNVNDPSIASDAATKGYVDNAIQGIDAKASVRLATTANITLSGAQTIDGIAVVNGDRILVKDQTNQAQNGVYTATAPTGAWVRSEDLDSAEEFQAAYVFVEEGTANKDTGWLCTNDFTGFSLDVTAVTWVQFSGAGQVVSGAGLTKSGNTLDVGAGAGITVNADSVQIANNGVTNAMIADGAVNLGTADVTGTLSVTKGGTGSSGSLTLARSNLEAAGYYSTATHGAGTTITITQVNHQCRASKGLLVQVQDEATGAVELPDIVVAANGDVTVTYGVSVSANSKRITVIG